MPSEYGLVTDIQNQYQAPVEQEEYSTSETIGALFDVNIIGHKYLWNNDIKWDYTDENFDPQQADEVFDRYGISEDHRLDLLDSSNSIQELEDRSKYRSEVDRSMEIVDSMGAKGIALSMGVSLLDVPSYIIGAGVGKVAQIGNTALKFGRTGQLLTAGTAGAVTGVASVAGLEATLGNELTQEQTAITAGLGFLIGYGASRIGMPSIQTDMNIAKTGMSGVPLKKPILSFLYSDADNMKYSTNVAEREAGMKASPAMDNRGSQTEDTVTDLDAKYNAKTHQAMHEYNEWSKVDFEAETGRKFTEEDDMTINYHGHKIDSEYTKAKDIEYSRLKEEYKPEIKAQIIAEQEAIKSSFEHELTPKKKQPTAKSKRKLKKELEKTKTKVNEEWNSKILKESRKNKAHVVDDLIEQLPSHYRKGVSIVKGIGRTYGEEINASKLDGLDVDTNFYWERKMDTNKIADNYEGAVDAYYRAIASNYNEIDDTLSEAIKQSSRNIVDKILASKDIMESYEIGNKFIREQMKMTKSSPSQLKGRKLKMDASELVEFMANDMTTNMKDYGHRVGGKLKAKNIYGIDKNYTTEQYMKDKGFTPEGKKRFRKVMSSTFGTRSIDPRGDTTSSRVVRAINQLNYINLGGFFGVNTLSDLAGIVNDYGFTNTMKYFTKEVVGTLQKEGTQGLKIARILGYSSEGMLGDRAAMWNSGDYGFNKINRAELNLQKGSNLMSKLTGMNMVVDMMDRTVAMASMDYILKANIGTKFTKNMNRLGLTADDVTALRANGFAEFDNIGITNVDLDKLPTDLRAKLERGLSRATRDTVIKANDIDTPDFLIEVMGSHALSKLLFQFMKFPVIAYNKLFNKMIHNFDALDAMTATATAAMVLGLTTQLKDIAKEDKKYDLTTTDGASNTAKYVIDRMPHLAPIGLVQSHFDVLGRLSAKYNGEDYKSYDRPISHLGVTPSRIADWTKSLGNVMNGTAGVRDVMTAKTMLSTNMFWLQPIHNISNDMIKEEFD